MCRPRCRTWCSMWTSVNCMQPSLNSSNMSRDLQKSTQAKRPTEKATVVSPWSKKIAKSHPPKTVKAQSAKRKSKKWRRQQTSSEEESDEDIEESASHSLKQKRPSSSCHSTPSGIEEVDLPVTDNIETVSRASSVAIREREYDDEVWTMGYDLDRSCVIWLMLADRINWVMARTLLRCRRCSKSGNKPLMCLPFFLKIVPWGFAIWMVKLRRREGSGALCASEKQLESLRWILTRIPKERWSLYQEIRETEDIPCWI